MNRRESFKSILLGAVAAGATITTATGCKEDTLDTSVDVQELALYGRTPEEVKRDNNLLAEVYLNEHELETIAILCDIILPATSSAGSATEAGVPAFIDFIVKDMPNHQLPIRGGLMWMDGEAKSRFDKTFKECSNQEQIAIIDDIAFSDEDGSKSALAYGIKFFDRMRGLVVTGYYTSQVGMKDLGYKGNIPNVWDGVPEEVLKKHGLAYEQEWLAKCVDQSKRNVLAEWDEDGNLLT